LENLTIIDGDGDETAGFGLALFASPLKDGDGAQVWRALGFFGYLTWILRAGSRGREQKREGERCLSGKTSLDDLR